MGNCFGGTGEGPNKRQQFQTWVQIQWDRYGCYHRIGICPPPPPQHNFENGECPPHDFWNVYIYIDINMIFGSMFSLFLLAKICM